MNWKTIDSAPRNGKVLLLYNGDIYMLGYSTVAGPWIEWGVGLPISQPTRAPTYWMELPTPPTEENSGG